MVARATPRWSLKQEQGGWYFAFTVEDQLLAQPRATVTSERLGRTKISQLGYENPDGSPLCVAHDFLDETRNPGNPMAGAIENLSHGPNRIKVWSQRQDKWHDSTAS